MELLLSGTSIPVNITVVTFRGITKFDHVAQHFGGVPHVRVRPVQAASADHAVDAIAQPADIVVLSTHGYTKTDWQRCGTHRRWPGQDASDDWYAGHRGTRAGFTISQLAKGLDKRGGLRAGLFVVDACGVSEATAAVLKSAAGRAGVLVLPQSDPDWAHELEDLRKVAERASRSPQASPEELTRDLERYSLVT